MSGQTAPDGLLPYLLIPATPSAGRKFWRNSARD